MKFHLSRFALALTALSIAPAAAAQSDVEVFTIGDAEALLADDAGTEQCEVRLENGQCPQVSQTRSFSFARPKSNAAGDSSTSGGSSSYIRPTKKTARQGRAKTIEQVATPARSQPREVPLQFALGSYTLSSQSKANLGNLALVLNQEQHKSKRIRITGHTDKSGSLEVNQRLSRQRADAAASYLETVGVLRSRIETEGRAFEDTLPGLSPYNPRNRRVEVQRVE